MSGMRVLIVGASIAGPSTAYWMAKAGAKVTVIERFPYLRPGGQAVDIRTCGVSVMRKMPGLEEQVLGKSGQEEGISFVGENGQPYGIIRATGDPDQQSIVSEYEIFRGDLAKILFDLTSNNKNIEYRFGENVVSLRQSDNGDNGVQVKFALEPATAEYDLVIACDGATSRTRAMGLGCGVREHIVPTNWWIAYFSTSMDLLQGSKIGKAFNGVGGRSITIGPDRDGRNRVMLTCIRPRRDVNVMSPFRRALSEGEDATKAYIAKKYRDMGWKTQIALQEMLSSSDFYATEVVQVKLPALYKSRFVLVGDAGYATGPTGGGTSIALTGGYVLAGEIHKHRGDIAAGLRGYEKAMRPLIRDVQKIPPLVSSIFAPQSALGIWVRNGLFAIVAWTGLAEVAQRYLGQAFSNTKDYPIPEYDWPEEDRPV